MTRDKPAAQYSVALVGVVGLSVATLTSLVADHMTGQTGQLTPLLAGGLISVCSASAAWLFGSGNGNGNGSSLKAPVLASPDLSRP